MTAGGEFNGSDRRLLQEIDRRTTATQTTVTGINGRLRRMDDTFVTKDAFKPVQRLAYGMAGSILTGFGGIVLWLLFQREI